MAWQASSTSEISMAQKAYEPQLNPPRVTWPRRSILAAVIAVVTAPLLRVEWIKELAFTFGRVSKN
jgi:hypothetical protein